MDTRPWTEIVAAAGAGPPDQDPTEPRPLKLTIADLELLDRRWDPDPIHSTELIDGRINFTPARYARRARATGELAGRLHDALEASGSPYFGGMRGSVAMPPHDLPLPDIVLTSEPNGDGFIPVSSVPLVMEVAETALDFFMDTKARLYAKHGVPEYWVVDLNGGTVHQMWSPTTDTYRERRPIALGETIAAATIAGLAIDTADLPWPQA